MKMLKTNGIGSSEVLKIFFKAKRFGLSPSSVANERFSNYA